MIQEANVSPSRSLTVIVPCYNEEANVRHAMADLWAALEGAISDFEILLVNDASTDGTGKIIDELAQQYPHTQAFHLLQNRGMGHAFFFGVAEGTKKYVSVFVGDNEIAKHSFRALVEQIGSADLLMAYHSNPGARPWHRRWLSRLFTFLVRRVSGTGLRYYNGPAVHLRAEVHELGVKNDGFGFLAEVTTNLLRRGHSYRELPIELYPRRHGISQALRWKSVSNVLTTLGRMAFQRGFGADAVNSKQGTCSGEAICS